MEYLHTMIRIRDILESLNFFCDILGMHEVRRFDDEKGRYTLVFLAAPGDLESAMKNQAPLLELTYNWPDENNNIEQYKDGRNFGHIAYGVDNIYDTCEHLMHNNVTIKRPPRDGHLAFVRSPDGISVALTQKGKPLEPKEPWLSMPNTGDW